MLHTSGIKKALFTMRISINQTLIRHLSGEKKAREIIERDYRSEGKKGFSLPKWHTRLKSLYIMK